MIAAFGLVPVAIAGALSCGCLLALLDSIKKPLGQRLQLGDGQIALLLAALNLTMIPLLPLVGVLIDRTGVAHGLIAGSLLAALAISLLALRDSPRTALGTVLLIGMALACLLTSTAVLLRDTFFAQRPAAALNLGYLFIGLAAVLMPWLTESLLPGLRWRRSLLLLALFCLLPALVAALTPANAFPDSQHGELERVFQDPLLWVAGLIAFLYLPVEAAVASWATNHLTGLGYPSRQAAWLLAGFWAAFLGARAVMAAVLGSVSWPIDKQAWVLVGLGLALAVALGNLAGTASRVSIVWGLLLTGLFSGAIYPTLLGTVLGRHADNPATAFATVQALGAMGMLVATPVMAYYGRHTSVQHALRIPLVGSLVLAGLALVMSLSW